VTDLAQIQDDAWLSDLFGYPVYRVEMPARAPANEDVLGPLRRRLEEMSDEPAFYYVKVSSSSVAQVEACAAMGFNVVDTSVTLERTGASAAGQSPGLEIRESLPEEETPILDMAEHVFTFSRFHLDPRMPAGLADKIKRAWVRECARGMRGEHLWVALLEGRPAGFLACLKKNEDGRAVWIIDLMGVDRTRRGLGVGRGLVDHFIREGAGHRALLRVGTQAANIPSLRLYQRCGFLVSDTQYVLHAHVGQPGGRP